MKKMFVGNLPRESSETSVKEMFADYGTVRSVQVATDIFTGHCRGFGFVEMEGHEARAAMAGLNGKSLGGNIIKVRFEEPRTGKGRRGR